MTDAFALPPLGSLAFVVSWMVTASVVSLLLAVVAVVAERILRGVVPVRWIWGVAIVAAVAFSLSQPWRRAEPPTPSLAVIARVVDEAPVGVAPGATVLDMLRKSIRRVPAQLRDASSALGHRMAELPAPAAQAVLLLWPFGTLLLAGLLVMSYRRQFRRAGSAPTAMVGAQPVRLSEDFGPAVVGVRAPLIVVPRWLLQRTPLEQQMVVAHEQSHVAAHDPLLLLTSCLTVVLLPWNAALWYMASRMRLAIELDCDARVLSAGRSRRHYGQLLIELSAAPSAMHGLQGVPAFSYRASHLERRLHTMTARPARFPLARRVTATALALSGVLAACTAELPTASDVQALDAVGADKQLTALTRRDADTRYFVDDVEKTREEAQAIAADRIATIDIRANQNGSRHMFIRTGTPKSGASAAGDRATASFMRTPDQNIRIALTADTANSLRVVGRALESRDGNQDSLPRLRLRATNSTDLPTPLVVLDGKRIPMNDLRSVSPDRILSVEVVKSAAATAQYGAEGANGVIIVTTKR